MKTYELVIEQRQPTCGGRAPTKSEIRTVTTADPAAYVQSQEPNCQLEVTNPSEGVILVTGERNGHWFKYEFTED